MPTKYTVKTVIGWPNGNSEIRSTVEAISAQEALLEELAAVEAQLHYTEPERALSLSVTVDPIQRTAP